MKRGTLRSTASALASGAAALTLALAASASAAPVVDGEFPLPAGQTVGSNNEIVQGPDGNMWVTTETGSVVRITPAGTAEAFPIPDPADPPVGIAVGPDNHLWVSTSNSVVEIDPANPAVQTDYAAMGLDAGGHGIAAGPDGRMWVAGTNELISFATSDPNMTFDQTAILGLQARGLDVGSDGLIWIADAGGRVISATASDDPVVTEHDIQIDMAGGAQDVAAGPNGQVAYAAPTTTPQTVGRLTSGAAPLITELDGGDPFGVEFGQDGAYWVARANANDLLRLTPDGQTSTLTGFSPPPPGFLGPRKVATGPNNTLWVTLDGLEAVGRVSGVGVEGSLDTKLDKKPKRKLKTKRKAKAKFKFSSSEAAANFECTLKRKGARQQAKFKACKSPKTYKLKPGRYTFQVRAVLGDLVDPTPAKSKFKVVKK